MKVLVKLNVHLVKMFMMNFSDVKTNLFADCEESFEDYGLGSDSDMDDMCEYKFDCSSEFNTVMHK